MADRFFGVMIAAMAVGSFGYYGYTHYGEEFNLPEISVPEVSSMLPVKEEVRKCNNPKVIEAAQNVIANTNNENPDRKVLGLVVQDVKVYDTATNYSIGNEMSCIGSLSFTEVVTKRTWVFEKNLEGTYFEGTTKFTVTFGDDPGVIWITLTA